MRRQRCVGGGGVGGGTTKGRHHQLFKCAQQPTPWDPTAVHRSSRLAGSRWPRCAPRCPAPTSTRGASWQRRWASQQVRKRACTLSPDLMLTTAACFPCRPERDDYADRHNTVCAGGGDVCRGAARGVALPRERGQARPKAPPAKGVASGPDTGRVGRMCVLDSGLESMASVHGGGCVGRTLPRDIAPWRKVHACRANVGVCWKLVLTGPIQPVAAKQTAQRRTHIAAARSARSNQGAREDAFQPFKSLVTCQHRSGRRQLAGDPTSIRS
jgi:hypothetical protein